MNYFIKILSIMVALIAINNISNFKFDIGEYYYYVLALALLIMLLLSRQLKINYLVLWLVGAALFSITLNQVAAVFSPYSRFIAFVVILSLIGPFIFSKNLGYFRLQLFNALNIIIVIFVITSFLGLLLNSSIVVGRSGFTGLFGHSMLLGPMAAVAMITLIEMAYSNKKKLLGLIYTLLAFVSFFTCIAAGSRVALIAGIAGTLFFIYKVNQNKLTRLIRIVLVLGSILILSYPIWDQFADRIISKMSYAEEMGDITVTRTAIWGLRFEEFLSSPTVGVGFASVDISILSNRFDPYEGRVEPGSSWLAILSMVGILGFIPFILLLYGHIKFILKDNKTVSQTAHLGSLLLLFIIHMLAEGYIFSAGSGLFFYFWLLLGIIERFKLISEKSKNKIEHVSK